MLNALRRRIDELSENLNKETGNVKTEIKNLNSQKWRIRELKQRIHWKESTEDLDETKDWISYLEDKVAENITFEQQKEIRILKMRLT